MTDDAQRERDRKFIQRLEYYATHRDSEGPERGDARAALAILRRGAGKPLGEVSAMFPYVVPFLSENHSAKRLDVRWWQEDVYYLIASLFAHHALHPPPEGSSSRSLGDSLAQYVTQRVQESGNSVETVRKSMDRQIALLLDSDRAALPRNMHHAIGLLKGIHIDWLALLDDLQRWEREGKPVQRWWAKGYFRYDIERAGDAAFKEKGSETEPDDAEADETDETDEE